MSVAAMAADPAVPEPLRVELDMVKRNVELESKLIDDLLDLTRITNGKLVIQPTAVDVHSLLNHTIQSCWESAGSTHVTLVKDYRAGSHFVSGDSARLSQIFWNLLKNAIKFTPDGGRIRVATENDSEGRLVVAVTDTGIGIEPELLPRIFDAFEQLSGDITRRYGGLGLGLAISKALVDLHGGTIDAQSKGRNMGATLTVTLNTVPAPDEAIASQDHATARINGRPLRVLLVEDHEMTARVASRLLRSMSYEVETAADVASALELAQSHPFDVIISDLGLPDGSGVDLLRKIRVESSVPAIAMSGYGMESDIRQTREAGFNEHLVKPLDFSKLQSAIHRVVNDARSKRSNQSAACSTLSAEL
jgi:CheY-like chemotaxis protein